MLDRAQNWWREARVRDDGSSLLRVNGLFGSSQFGSPSHTYPIPVKFGPDGSLYLATWDYDCCRAQLPASAPGRLMKIDYIGDQVDTTAPVIEPAVTGTQNPSGAYLGRATLNVNATDSSGISRIEYSLDGTQWERYTAPVGFTTRGSYTVRVRATDRANNTSEIQSVTFTVVAGEACQPSRSDEFNGALNTALWNYRHSTTPATGAKAPSVSGGNLVLPLGAFSVDLTRTGPIGFIGQPLPTGDFTVVAKLSAPGLNTDVGGVGSAYAQAGLKIYQGDNNWIKVAHNRNADGNPTGSAQTYFELANEVNGTRTLGTRTGLAGTNLPTWWMRVVRTGATITASYSLTDPDGAGATWVGLGTANVDTVMPAANGPRYIGVYGGNGSVNVLADYVRFTPDSPNDAAAPVSSHSLAAADGSAGWHRTPVNVTLDAADDGECVSGVDKTEYRVGSGALQAYTAPIAIMADGTHTIEYRSTDKAGNAETAKSVAVKLDAAAPVTTHSVAADGHRAGDADAGRDGCHVRGRAHRVPRQRVLVRRVRRGRALRRRGGVADLQRGQQAGVHGQRDDIDRVPLDGRGRQRGDAEDGDVHGRRAHGRRRDRAGHQRVSGPGDARPRPDLPGPGDREVLRARHGGVGGEDRRRQRHAVDAVHRHPQRG